jgi:ribosomal protein S18 acetylase RimI-like enzyme
MLQVINDQEHFSLSFVQQLYEATFPLHERREWKDVLRLLSHPPMQMILITDGGADIGFAIGWRIGHWYFLEHLAIDPAQRGKQYGSQVMQELIVYAEKNIILEVEPAHDELALRRIRFYERLGFQLAPFPYLQPPYRQGELPVRMELMSMPPIIRAEEMGEIAQAIKATVYEAFY